MAKKKQTNETEALKEAILAAMIEKKGVNIVVMDLKELKNVISDYFILCTGTSDAHVDAVSDAVLEETFKKLNENPRRKEGKKNKEWILLDYLDIVVHIFKKDKREFYGLEQLWGDAKFTYIDDENQPQHVVKAPKPKTTPKVAKPKAATKSPKKIKNQE